MYDHDRTQLLESITRTQAVLYRSGIAECVALSDKLALLVADLLTMCPDDATFTASMSGVACRMVRSDLAKFPASVCAELVWCGALKP
jgi:hypothetical protein